MKRVFLMGCGVIFLGFSAACLAGNPGDVTLVNNNRLALGSNDVLQFQLLTNGDGLVTTGALPASPPDNRQTLSHWDFSDQTINFTIYVRDVSKNQTDYTPCSSNMPYNHTQTPITVYGTSDGVTATCKIQS